MRLSDFDYRLPDELIAQRPAERRDASRLMVLQRETGDIEHARFDRVQNYLDRGDVLVLNNTRVIPARLHGVKADTGARIEALLIQPLKNGVWEAMARPGRRLKPGARVSFADGKLNAEVLSRTDAGTFRFRFDETEEFDERLNDAGEIPLPPYIRRAADAEDRERYQCVFARRDGAVAAPTAGLHFTPGLLSALRESGVETEEVTLHVGLGTFQPVQSKMIEKTRLHAERAELTPEVAQRLNDYHEQGRRVVAVGTTTTRTLETAARSGIVEPFSGSTELFISPGFPFRATDALITNFHLPKSSLLMLVAAFAGYDFMRRAYEVAVAERYRFYSYGDAMLIL